MNNKNMNNKNMNNKNMNNKNMYRTTKRKMTEEELLRVCCGYIEEYLSEIHSKMLFESYQ